MKWGILGTGTIAKKFANTLRSMNDDNETLCAVGSRSEETAASFAEAFGIPHAYGSYEALAASPEAEGIYVATPNSAHYENVKLCLESGKHVLCEKPFTLTAGQAEELYALAKEKGLFLMEAFWIRHLPLYGRIRQIIASGAIGEVKQIRAQYGFAADAAKRYRKFRKDLGGGALLDIGIYTIGFAGMITGEEPSEVASDVRMNEYGTDEYSRITLWYPCGAEAELITTIGTALPREGEITGTKGRIFLPDFQNAERMTVYTGDTAEDVSMPFEATGFEYEIRESSRCVSAGLTESPVWTAADSIAMTRLLEDIRVSWGMDPEGK